jgi:D-beta-D-heptose 7-phosphate kinase/D-beta-D-heptose 1-phosphate adenosyltransferase
MHAVIVSGYFNPLHKGHLELFEQAKTQGTELWVIVNNDHQRSLKGSKEFMDENERLQIVRSLKMVDKAFLSIDEDSTQCLTLKALGTFHSYEYGLAFANGGDQDNNSIPEAGICQELGISLIDGLGDKVQSSSWLLK